MNHRATTMTTDSHPAPENEPTWDALDAIVAAHKLDTLSVIDTAKLIWNIAQERDTAVAHANGLTDLIRGTTIMTRDCETCGAPIFMGPTPDALKAAHAAQIAAPQELPAVNSASRQESTTEKTASTEPVRDSAQQPAESATPIRNSRITNAKGKEPGQETAGAASGLQQDSPYPAAPCVGVPLNCALLLREIRDYLWPNQDQEWEPHAKQLCDQIDSMLSAAPAAQAPIRNKELVRKLRILATEIEREWGTSSESYGLITEAADALSHERGSE